MDKSSETRVNVKEEAEKAETKAEHGDITGLTKQLYGMRPDDRLATVKEMEKLNEQRRKSDDSLPKLEISTKTDAGGSEVLVDVNVREKRGWYNPTRLVDTYDSGAAVYHSDFATLADGSTQQIEYDLTTGKRTIERTVNPSGDRNTVLYSPNTGKVSGEFTMDANLRTIRTSTYDPKGRLQSVDRFYSDFTEEPGKTDPTAGGVRSIDRSFGHGKIDTGYGGHGFTEHIELDPTTGNRKIVDRRNPDGMSGERIEYDAAGHGRSYDIKNSDGSTEHIEIDPTTQQFKSLDRTAGGVTEHFVFDPATQHFKPADGRKASRPTTDKK